MSNFCFRRPQHWRLAGRFRQWASWHLGLVPNWPAYTGDSLYRWQPDSPTSLYPLFSKWFDWGPGQPSGRDQHCLYIVGGFLGYQWADFHCEFEVNPLDHSLFKSLLQMTFLCEYRVNRGDVWTHPSLPSYSPVQEDNRWQLSTIQPPPSPSSTLPTLKPTSRPTSATSTTPRPTLFSLFDIPAKQIENNLVEAGDLVKQGSKNQIEVISRDKSSVIFQKKDPVVVSESLKQEDDTSWSIFQFLKNVIKMPAILNPSASYV